MASLDQMQSAQAANKDGNKDVELAVRMTIKLLKDGGGMKVIVDALKQSKDPAQVIGQFLAQIVGQLGEKLVQEMGVDPQIFLAKDGWLDKVLDFIEQALGMPSDFSDQIYNQVLEVIKAAAMEAPPQGGQPPQQAAAPQPQQPGGLGG